MRKPWIQSSSSSSFTHTAALFMSLLCSSQFLSAHPNELCLGYVLTCHPAITSLKSLLHHVPCCRTTLYACKVLHNLVPPQAKYSFRVFFLSFSFLSYTCLESLPLSISMFIPCVVLFLFTLQILFSSFPGSDFLGIPAQNLVI